MTSGNGNPETGSLHLQMFQLRALHDVVEEIGSERDERKILTIAAAAVAGAMGTGTTVALRGHPGTDQVEPVYHLGLEADALAVLEGADLTCIAAETGRKVVALDKTRQQDELEAAGLKLWVPIIVNDEVAAGVCLGPRLSQQPYSPSDLSLIETMRIAVEQALHNAYLHAALEKANAQLERENQDLEDRVDAGAAVLSRSGESGAFGEFVGDSPPLRAVQQKLADAATSDMTVLITGETGTGKGLAATALHGLSRRRDGPFIQVNCGAISESLIDSELFGHEKGAFTGALARKLGRIDLARGGTLFLDEIGDMPAETQIRLLRLLEEGTYERLGGTETLKAEVRIVAATNRHLEQMVADDTFRQDLYYRLRGFPVELPPLRERRDDIVALAEHFIGPMAAHLGQKRPKLSGEVKHLLRAFDWPGNVRELKHIVERAVVASNGGVIRDADMPLIAGRANGAAVHGHMSMEEVERRHICRVLEDVNWVMKGPNGAASELELPVSTLRNRMRKLGIVRG